MRIFTLLLIFICLSIAPGLYAQQKQGTTITLSVKNAPLETVLGQIKKQAGITFVYNGEILKKVGKVSIQIDKADLQTVLKQLFQHTSVNYVQERTIVILTNKTDADGNIKIDITFFSTITVSGTVYGAGHAGLNGATVTDKRTHSGTVTNAKGEFKLDVRNNDTLQFSYIGYATQNIPVSGQPELIINLSETQNELDQVVVQAYGTTTRRLAVGEISQVSGDQIARQPISNPMLALEGLVPGLLITPTSGISSAPVKVEIRGRNTLDPNAPSDPLYIIDGVPLITLNLGYGPTSNYKTGSAGFAQSGGSLNGNSLGQSPFFSLNPKDIESITVLKDAEATAMYGSRAGNGVIIITTKKGKAGETKFDINTDKSVNLAIANVAMLNTSQYLQMRREAFSNDGLTPNAANAPDLTLWDPTRDVDWQKQLLQTSHNTDINTNLSGGNNFMTFRLSGSYSSIQDLSALTNGNANKKATVNLSLNHTSPNQKFTFSFNGSYGYTNSSQAGFLGGNITLPPDAPAIFDKYGNLNYAAWNAVSNLQASGAGNTFPFAGLLQPTLASTYFLNGNINLSYQIIKGLGLAVNLGYNNSQYNTTSTIPIASQNPLDNPIGTANFGNNSNIGLNVSPQIDYSHFIGKGTLTATIGASLNDNTANTLTVIGSGYADDNLLKSIINAPVQYAIQSYGQNKYVDAHARLSYNWENKYIIETTGNRDGSSSFGPGRQFANFWSGGFNWIASEEKWLKETLPSWVSLVKFGGTYGTTGISGGDYQYLTQWSASASGPAYQYNGVVPLVPIHAVNQDYRWETDRQLNLSFDLGFLDDRFNLYTSFYRKRVNDQLSQLPTPVFTGFPLVEGNSKADLQNTGIEINLSANLIQAKDFSWSASFNTAFNNNKLLAFPDIQYTPYYTKYRIGQSINSIYLLHYLGIDPQTGQRSYEDYNHDGQITTGGNGVPGSGSNDAYITYSTVPKFEGGFSTNLRYKNLSLNLGFSFKAGIMIPKYYTGTPGQLTNVPPSALSDYWQKPGDIAINPRLSTSIRPSDSNFLNSDGGYTDGSFLRLQTVAIGYSLPDKLSKTLGLQQMSIGINMSNIFTLTKYDGIDADVPFGNQPQAKVINGNITFTF